MKEQILENYIIEKNNLILETLFIKKLEFWNLTKYEFIDFWKQRYLIPKMFEELLESWIEKAKNELKDKWLENNLYINYLDENGLDTNWNKLEIGSHKEWRKNFNDALFINISDEELQSTKKYIWTKKFIDSYKILLNSWNWLMIIWALLFLEYNIPEEYKKVKIARDILFKDSFVINEDDSIETKNKKRLWCMYIDDHIIHDSRVHYPTLKLKLLKYLNDDKSFEFIKKWIDIISKWKLDFYEWLNK